MPSFVASAASAVVVATIALSDTHSSLADAAPVFNTPIEHVVVLMEENRAFDHMLGWYPGVNGLKGNETNLVNTSDPSSDRVTVGKTSPYVGPFDPDHSTPATTDKIFGQDCLARDCNEPTMSGFVEFETARHGEDAAKSVMNMFTPDRVPIMSTLAQEFAVFDRFFCSHPGPTFPNRLFHLMGSSKGDTETKVWDPNSTLYTGRTVFDIVEEAGHDWAYYYADAPLEMAMVEKLTFHPGKIHGWERFKKDIAEGSLPAYSYVNPRWFVNLTSLEGSSDQHPDHDVRLGEALMKEVYEDLRASPKWNSTLFVITYDEHGGFYDHVPPPMNVPTPDDFPSFPDKNFKFNRLGVRIPTLLISPWIPKGTVISEPLDGEKPQENSEFDLTSIISTVRKMFAPSGSDIQPLTRRDAWSATFEDRLTQLSAPRTDCPTTLPDAPKSLGQKDALREAAQPLNDLQVDIVAAYENLRIKTGLEAQGDLPKFQGEASEWIAKIVDGVLAANKMAYGNDDLGNCEKYAYDFCCAVGTPCDCTKGTTAPGQCKETSYAYCCTVGTPCDCSQPPLDVDEEPTVAVPEESLPTDSEKPVQADDVTPIDGFEVDVLGNCKKVPYDFCCAVGTPCDCTKGTTAPGQCQETAYAYCCSVGTPCDCSQPPLEDADEPIDVIAVEEPIPAVVENPVQTDDVTPVDGFEVDVLGNCKKIPYDYCCAFGTPCNCTEGTTAPGQCQETAYAYCCTVGTPCDCSQPALEDIDAPAHVIEVVEPEPVEEVHEDDLGNCKKVPYDFCCAVGTPCDCTKGTTAPGQCQETAYAYCCSVGTPCDCSQPPLEDADEPIHFIEPVPVESS